MDKSKYKNLIIVGEPEIDIWLGDEFGYFVQKGIGTLSTSLLPGNYTVEFGLGNTCYPICLTYDVSTTQAEITSGPSCPRPKVK